MRYAAFSPRIGRRILQPELDQWVPEFSVYLAIVFHDFEINISKLHRPIRVNGSFQDNKNSMTLPLFLCDGGFCLNLPLIVKWYIITFPRFNCVYQMFIRRNGKFNTYSQSITCLVLQIKQIHEILVEILLFLG